MSDDERQNRTAQQIRDDERADIAAGRVCSGRDHEHVAGHVTCRHCAAPTKDELGRKRRTMADVHAMPIATNGVDRIGWQAQCQACDWNSITHLERSEAFYDAELHKGYYPHKVIVFGVADAATKDEPTAGEWEQRARSAEASLRAAHAHLRAATKDEMGRE